MMSRLARGQLISVPRERLARSRLRRKFDPRARFVGIEPVIVDLAPADCANPYDAPLDLAQSIAARR